MQSVFDQSKEEKAIIWTPLMKISTSEYIDKDWDSPKSSFMGIRHVNPDKNY